MSISKSIIFIAFLVSVNWSIFDFGWEPIAVTLTTLALFWTTLKDSKTSKKEIYSYMGVSILLVISALLYKYFIKQPTVEERYKENDHYIYQGVTKVFNSHIYDGMGMAGMRNTVEECYDLIDKNSSKNDIKRCFSMDLASHFFDDGMANFMNWPPNIFFLQENVKQRLEKAFDIANMRYSEWEDIINNEWVPKIRRQYEDTSERNILDK
jgi:hypothetical protein